MPPARSVDPSRPRRDPLSCQSCRVKKLKCDRKRPCSNCTTRRLCCEYHSRPAKPPVEARAAVSRDQDLHAENAALKARIEKLESAVFGTNSPTTSSVTDAASSVRTILTIQEPDGERAAFDVERLEGLGGRLAELLPSTLDDLHVTVQSAEHFLPAAEQYTKPRPICLPPHHVSAAYLGAYEEHVDAVQPIMHVPSVREMMDDVYNKLLARQPLSRGPVALILAICAYVELWEVHRTSLLSHSQTTRKASSILANQALYALESARMSSQISIEVVQATILLMFHLGHIEGISSQSRLLHSSAITIARALGLHRVDAPNMTSNAATQADVIKMEIGRRLWWHLAGSDWLFAYIGGPHEGIYSVQTQHMAVRVPRNINQGDLSCRDGEFEQPKDEITTMTFSLQRIKLAILCKEVLDTLLSPSIVLEHEMIPYESILSLDSKFCALIDDLPKTIQSNASNHSLQTEPRSSSKNNLPLQRLLITLLVHTRRCRLHLPFMTHFKSDPRYVFSRQVCLESARKVFQARERFLSEETTGALRAIFRMGKILGLILYATTVLAIDLCVHGSDNMEQTDLAEVRNAIKVAEEARSTSQIAAAFWESLMDVLQTHQVRIPSAEYANGPINGKGVSLDVSCTTQGSRNGHWESQPTDESMDGSASFENIWQQCLSNESFIDPQSWDALLNDLEMHAA